jgi:hypothetical protein
VNRKDSFLVRWCSLLCLCIGLVIAPMTDAIAGLGDPHYSLQVGDMEIVNDGTNNAIYVRGTFTPALPCPIQGFVYFAADPFEKEMTGMIITAKATGRNLTYAHSYCMSSGAATGYSRGNGVVLQ